MVVFIHLCTILGRKPLFSYFNKNNGKLDESPKGVGFKQLPSFLHFLGHKY